VRFYVMLSQDEELHQPFEFSLRPRFKIEFTVFTRGIEERVFHLRADMFRDSTAASPMTRNSSRARSVTKGVGNIFVSRKVWRGLYKSSIMRHTSVSLSWRIFYYAMFDHKLEPNNRRTENEKADSFSRRIVRLRDIRIGLRSRHI
jgi:hypothetical protein